jgi:hypothetical protein
MGRRTVSTSPTEQNGRGSQSSPKISRCAVMKTISKERSLLLALRFSSVESDVLAPGRINCDLRLDWRNSSLEEVPEVFHFLHGHVLALALGITGHIDKATTLDTVVNCFLGLTESMGTPTVLLHCMRVRLQRLIYDPRSADTSMAYERHRRGILHSAKKECRRSARLDSFGAKAFNDGFPLAFGSGPIALQ